VTILMNTADGADSSVFDEFLRISITSDGCMGHVYYTVIKDNNVSQFFKFVPFFILTKFPPRNF
jgi:hypothetical protein